MKILHNKLKHLQYKFPRCKDSIILDNIKEEINDNKYTTNQIYSLQTVCKKTKNPKFLLEAFNVGYKIYQETNAHYPYYILLHIIVNNKCVSEFLLSEIANKFICDYFNFVIKSDNIFSILCDILKSLKINQDLVSELIIYILNYQYSLYTKENENLISNLLNINNNKITYALLNLESEKIDDFVIKEFKDITIDLLAKKKGLSSFI